jgi:hypothetical protein
MILVKTPICQSCGMPLTDETILATNQDGTANHEYCIYCYEDGNFTEPNITMQEMSNICVHYMLNENHGFDEPAARKIMNDLLPTLHRWK